jgi:murein L,D-transpeptidase YafK
MRPASFKAFNQYLIIILAIIFLPLSIFSSSKEKINNMIADAFKNYTGKYIIHISKKDFRLYVRDRRRIVEKFMIGYGKNPDRRPKLFEGDMRTPEGMYRITEILSMDAGRNTESYKKLRELNDRYLTAEEGACKFGQPNVDTGKNAYGPRLLWLDYPNREDGANYAKAVEDGIIPMKDGKLPGIGFGITIHGNNDPPSVGELSSLGCIIMYNKDLKAVQVCESRYAGHHHGGLMSDVSFFQSYS